MRRTLVLTGTLYLLWFLVVLLNDLLSPLRVYVFAGGLFVFFAAATQPWKPGLIAVMLGGLICDAHTPVIFGTHLLLFAAAHTVLFRLREKMPRDDNSSAIAVVLLTNLGLFLAFSFTRIHDSPAPAAVWPRLIADLVCSQVFLVLVTPWFLSLQAASLALARVPRDEVA